MDKSLMDNGAKSPPCPFCNDGYGVDDEESLPSLNANLLRIRRYICSKNQDHIFWTQEHLALGQPMLVFKKDGTNENFDASRFLRSIEVAMGPDTGEIEKKSNVYSLAHSAYDALWKSKKSVSNKEKGVTSEDIGTEVLRQLKQSNDLTTWIRFAVVFFGLDKNRKSIREIVKILNIQWHKK